MTKYTSNEQYEKDRLKIIARHSVLKDMGVDIIELLKVSKWAGNNTPEVIIRNNGRSVNNGN